MMKMIQLTAIAAAAGICLSAQSPIRQGLLIKPAEETESVVAEEVVQEEEVELEQAPAKSSWKSAARRVVEGDEPPGPVVERKGAAKRAIEQECARH